MTDQSSADVPGSTDSSLLEKVQGADPEAWKRLVRLYSPVLYRWCRHTGLPAEDAADVLRNPPIKRRSPESKRSPAARPM